MRRSLLIVGALAAGALGVHGLAAHTLAHTRRDTVTVSELQVAIVAGYDSPPGADSRQLRRTFDRDADGALSAEEAEAAEGWLAARATARLRLWVDGAPAALTLGASEVHGLDEPVGSGRSLQIAVTLTAPLPSAAARPALTLILEDEELGRREAIALTARDEGPRRLLAAELVPRDAASQAPSAPAGRYDPAGRALSGVILTPADRLVLRLGR